MFEKLTLLKGVRDKKKTDLELIKDLYTFLQGVTPTELSLKKCYQPKLSHRKAFTIIYYLQEVLPLLPDFIEPCHHCGVLFNTEEEGLYWESKGNHYCGTCEYLVPPNYDNNQRC